MCPVRVAPVSLILAVHLLPAAHAVAQEVVLNPSDLEVRVSTASDTLIGGASGVAVDRLGFVYVATFHDRLYRYKGDEGLEVFAAALYGATGNAVDPRGNVYQANFFGDYVTRIDRHGAQTTFAAGFSGPMGLAYADDRLYVTNCSTSTIGVVEADGTSATSISSDLLNCPNGIARADDGHFYVVNFYDGELLRMTPEGDIERFTTLPHTGNTISAVRGHLYVASVIGKQVHRVSLTTGEVSLVAGNGRAVMSDGSGLDAGFSSPNGIAATGDGRVYVSDVLGDDSPVRGALLRVISVPSLTDRLGQIVDEKGLDAMVEAYHRLRANPASSALLDEGEMNGWGRLLMRGSPNTAIRVFELNAASYPGSWRAFDSLGEAYASLGQTTRAIDAFEESVRLNPDNTRGLARLRDLRSPD